MTAPLWAALCALVLALVLTPLWMRVARRIGAIDHPRDRHQHRGPTPTAGGVAIFVSVWAPVLALMDWPPSSPLVGMLLGTCLLVLLNIYDDIRGIPAVGRLAAQIAIALVALTWGVRIEGIGNLGGLLGQEAWVELGWLSAPLTVLWLVVITNAINWLDGLDGLAAGVAGISALALAIMAAFSRIPVAPAVGIMAAAMVGACLGFLRYNFTPARVFMGDTGAMFLGFSLACLAVIGPLKAPAAATLLLPVLVLGVPLYDSTSAVFKRVLNGKNPLVGDRTHIHHRLVDRGLTVKQAVLVIYAFSGALCLLALGLWWR